MSDVDDARKAVAAFSRAFAAADAEKLLALWDDEYPNPVCQPEETLEPYIGIEAIASYINHIPVVIKGVTDIRPIDFQVDVVGDIALAYARAEATLQFAREDGTLAGQVRQTLVFRRRDDGWRLIQYHESRLTPGLEKYVA
jgi:ketosteroid isomerase-like protein